MTPMARILRPLTLRQKGSATIWLLLVTASLLPLLILITSFVIVSAAEQRLRQVADVAALAGAQLLEVPGAGCATARATVDRAIGGWRTEVSECRIDASGTGSLLITLSATPPISLPSFVRRLLPGEITASARAGWVA
jgi:secretion/DNA translocation related TadE-like protein